MKFSNFKLIKEESSSLGIGKAVATVDITTGFWIFKKTKTVEVFKTNTLWRFSDTGEYVSGWGVDNLYEAHKVKKWQENCY
jgi:hypothetical protein